MQHFHISREETKHKSLQYTGPPTTLKGSNATNASCNAIFFIWPQQIHLQVQGSSRPSRRRHKLRKVIYCFDIHDVRATRLLYSNLSFNDKILLKE
jgi:hypothetical protein